MASLDEIFYKEFKATCSQRKALSGAINLNSIAVSDEFKEPVNPAFKKMSKVRLKGITENYYSELNSSDVFLWVRPRLMRRTFDCEGKFIRDTKTNKYVTKDVTLPQNCCTVLSTKCIKVPLKYKAKENFDYVDFVTVGGTNYYIYIVPKCYCYKLNELCLAVSMNRMRYTYSAIELKLLSGHTIYLSVIPYKPSRASEASYRVLSIKTSRDFTKEWASLMVFWQKSGILYPRELCQLSEPVREVMNVAYRELNSTLDEYQVYDYTKSLADTGNDSFDDENMEVD